MIGVLHAQIRESHGDGLSEFGCELCLNLGDGVDQAAACFWLASMPSVNLIPSMSFGNWFCPSSLRQEACAAWIIPAFAGTSLEHHDDGGVVRQAAFAAGCAMADGEGALDGVAGADVFPMLGREIVECQQRPAIFGQARGRLVVFAWYLARKRSQAFSASARPSAIQISLRSASALDCTDFGSLFSTFIVLCTQHRGERRRTKISGRRIQAYLVGTLTSS
jgi:hypothetical protein